MDRHDVNWQGYFASCPTPFREGDESIDLETLAKVLESYVDSGLHGVLVNGTVGEWFSQSESERRAVVAAAIEAVAGRMTVIVGCTAYTAKEVVQLATHALDAGADGVAASAPPYAKCFPDEIVQYYIDIASGIDGPLMVYNWPHGTGVDIGPDVAERLVEIDRVVALKDSTPNLDQFYETTARVVASIRVFGPFVSARGLEVLQQEGGDGFIGGGSLFGGADAAFWEDFWRRDLDACVAHARRFEAIFPRLWLPGGWAGVHGAYQSELKVIMALLGTPAGSTRRPRLPISNEAAIAEIREVLTEFDLLDAAAGASR
jgi:dihydrodipicolinate synthase/N-acetylneuraminate lyase